MYLLIQRKETEPLLETQSLRRNTVKNCTGVRARGPKEKRKLRTTRANGMFSAKDC